MIFTIEEMTFLCLIQNLNGLIGFPKFNILSKEQSENVIQSLTQKKILNKEKLLTDNGLKISNIISLYAHSKMFYKFGKDSVFAKYHEKEYVMLSCIDNQYHVDLVNQDQISLIIINKFQNWKSIKDGEYKKNFFPTSRFNEFVENNKNMESIFYYKADLENKTDFKGVLFIHDGYLKSYDIKSEEIHFYPRAMVQQSIERILG